MKTKKLQYILLFDIICFGLLLITNQYSNYLTYHDAFWDTKGILGTFLLFSGISLYLKDSVLKACSVIAFIIICVSILVVFVAFIDSAHPKMFAWGFIVWSISSIILSCKYLKTLKWRNGQVSYIGRVAGLLLVALVVYCLLPRDKSFFYKFHIMQNDMYIDVRYDEHIHSADVCRLYFKKNKSSTYSDYIELNSPRYKGIGSLKLFIDKNNKHIYIYEYNDYEIKIHSNQYNIQLLESDSIATNSMYKIETDLFGFNFISNDVDIEYLGTHYKVDDPLKR